MIRVDVLLPLVFDEQLIRKKCAEKLRREIAPSCSVRLLRLTVDAHDPRNICYKTALLLSLDKKSESFLIQRGYASKYEETPFSLPKIQKTTSRPVIVGLGPCGLFAALILAESGACPIILERGMDVETRTRAVENFYRDGILDPENNIQFGEGGAGSFSDGKLKVGSMTGQKRKVLETLVWAGAPEQILYSGEAHVGTDLLRNIVKKIRQHIEDLGGTVIFGAKLEDIVLEKANVRGIRYRYQNQ